MKDKYWHIDAMDYFLFGLSILGILLVIMSHRAKNDVDSMITTTDTVTVTDTITNWQAYNVYHYRTDTAYLPIVQYQTDTIIKLDSVFVQIPIDTYHYDTTIRDSNYTTHLKAVVSGFGVEMDSLYLNTKITQQKPKKQPWYGNIVPAVGVGFGTGGFGVFAGVGLKIF